MKVARHTTAGTGHHKSDERIYYRELHRLRHLRGALPLRGYLDHEY